MQVKLTDLELHHNRLTGLVPHLNFAAYEVQCSLDAVGASPRGPQDPRTTGPCREPNCNKFACPLPAGSDQCVWGFGAGVHCKNVTAGGYGGLGLKLGRHGAD